MSSSVLPSLHSAAPKFLSVRWLFILTLFCSAGLLFMVQPMFGRMAMPVLGGAPAVWNVAMVFFQTTLLAGYFYAHMLNKLPLRIQVFIHLAVLAAALLMLPVQLDADTLTPDASMPTLWLLGLMVKTVGLPFFAISAQAPLMQRWFARSDDPQAADPYFLYSASNIGSILGLLAYPVIMEPFFTVTAQASVWSVGFSVLLFLVLTAGIRISRMPQRLAECTSTSGTSVSRKTLLYWIVLAAIPSGLLLSVTNNITTDIAAVPLMWAPPLLAYLLSFVIAFAPPRWLSFDTIQRYAPYWVIGLSLMGAFSGTLGIAGNVLLQVVFFFGIALACHATLVATRPDADGLTQFYLMMSLGGAIGGALVALLAPVLFNWIFEHPILIVAAALLLAVPPARAAERQFTAILEGTRQRFIWDIIFIGIGLLLAVSIAYSARIAAGPQKVLFYTLPVMFLLVLCFLARQRAVRFAMLVGICSLTFGGFAQLNIAFDKQLQVRSFFGVYRVGDNKKNQIRIISHGTTIHGAQSKMPAFMYEPQSYYVPDSGIGQIMRTTPAQKIGIVGLGSGALACYAKPGQDWTFYEIDPLVVKIALNEKLFTYLSACTPSATMKIGDARLQLKYASAHAYDLLVIDAFASDSIPLHLITADAFALYRAKLDKSGALMVHISNQHMNLQPVIGNIAALQGWRAWVYTYQPDAKMKITGRYATPSKWVLLAPDKQTAERQFARMGHGSKGWQIVPADPSHAVWTDNYANTLSVLKWFQ
jgi:hypothetical protein